MIVYFSSLAVNSIPWLFMFMVSTIYFFYVVEILLLGTYKNNINSKFQKYIFIVYTIRIYNKSLGQYFLVIIVIQKSTINVKIYCPFDLLNVILHNESRIISTNEITGQYWNYMRLCTMKFSLSSVLKKTDPSLMIQIKNHCLILFTLEIGVLKKIQFFFFL